MSPLDRAASSGRDITAIVHTGSLASAGGIHLVQTVKKQAKLVEKTGGDSNSDTKQLV